MQSNYIFGSPEKFYSLPRAEQTYWEKHAYRMGIDLFPVTQDYDTSDIPQLTYRDRYNDIEQRLTSAQGSESSKLRAVQDLGQLIEDISQSLRTDAQDEDLMMLKEDAESLFKLY